jgi:hypothetical protein
MWLLNSFSIVFNIKHNRLVGQYALAVVLWYCHSGFRNTVNVTFTSLQASGIYYLASSECIAHVNCEVLNSLLH